MRGRDGRRSVPPLRARHGKRRERVRDRRTERGGGHMATWLWILIIVLVVLALFGGLGYRRY
jgi:hypothetical protein